MDKIREENFVKTFISKRVQNRLLFELFSSSKRDTGIDRFSHNIEDIVDIKKIYKKNFDFQNAMIIINKLTKTKYNECYVISSNIESDGKLFTYQEAIDICNDYLGPSVIILSETMILIKTEQVKGAAENYLLIK